MSDFRISSTSTYEVVLVFFLSGFLVKFTVRSVLQSTEPDTWYRYILPVVRTSV